MNAVVENFRSLRLVQFASGTVNVLFSPDTLQLFRLNDATASVVRDCSNGSTLEEICSRHNRSETGVLKLFEDITASVANSPRFKAPERWKPFDPAARPILPKLVFMVNNYCNLKCTYCYEHETVFTRKSIDMSRPIASRALEKFYETFHSIHQLMFIGGEPSLSEDLIEFAVQRAIELSRKNGGPDPEICMITNGTHMTERLFEIIRTYDIQLTFSIDGPANVHDANRTRKDGSGTYDEVNKNIKRYSETHHHKLGLECTLSQTHHDMNVTVSDLVDFFAKEFGVRAPHIAAAGLPNESRLNPYKDEGVWLESEYEAAAKKSVQNIFDGLIHAENSTQASGNGRGTLDMVSGMLKTLMHRKGFLEMCPAGTTQLTIDAFGDIYPCWMFAGVEAFKMGNVVRDDIFNEASLRVLDQIRRNNKDHNPICSQCYARYVCHACIGNNFNSTGSIANPNEHFCNTVRGSLRSVLLAIAELQTDPGRWNQVREGVRSIRGQKLDGMKC
jgi:uncharacterized protein